MELLPHRCLFDGCRYGLHDGVRLCRKPWRVQTDWVDLTGPLSKQCDHTHEHGVLRGRSAARSERYTPAL
eukprot:4767503-Heterocapsa_arctica.AAC.1